MNFDAIHINNLLLDLDNPRFPRIVESQREAVNLMIEIQSVKIEALAKDISEFGLVPSEQLIIYKNNLSDNQKAYTVDEGNSLLTALKLLQEPELSDDEKLKSRIKKQYKLVINYQMKLIMLFLTLLKILNIGLI